MTKTAIVVLSDPKSGGEEALGRLFNAMFTAFELKEKKADVALIFQGAGVRWAAEVVKPGHPAHALFKAVESTLVGVCGGCVDVFDDTGAVKKSGLALVREKEIPGTNGVIDLSKYLDQGYQILTF